MALIVEDGTGLTNADAYVDVADVDTYFTLRGNTDWVDLETAEKEAAIVRATFALDSKYGISWVGIKGSQEQALQWPRIAEKDSTTGVTDADGYEIAIDTIPPQVLNACCEVALIESTERFLVQSTDTSAQKSTERVGPITTSWYKYGEGGTIIKQYPHIDAILYGLASAAGGATIEVHLTDREKEQDAASDLFSYPDYFHMVKYD